ncbi:hypothetical protein BD414DRAFT_385360, partial [Trametes punicea]
AHVLHWLATTTFDLTFVGEPINPLAARSKSDQSTIVVYCATKWDLGTCTVYCCGPVSLSAGGTACLAATSNVAFCSTDDCGAPCTELKNCG